MGITQNVQIRIILHFDGGTLPPPYKENSHKTACALNLVMHAEIRFFFFFFDKNKSRDTLFNFIHVVHFVISILYRRNKKCISCKTLHVFIKCVTLSDACTEKDACA